MVGPKLQERQSLPALPETKQTRRSPSRLSAYQLTHYLEPCKVYSKSPTLQVIISQTLTGQRVPLLLESSLRQRHFLLSLETSQTGRSLPAPKLTHSLGLCPPYFQFLTILAIFAQPLTMLDTPFCMRDQSIQQNSASPPKDQPVHQKPSHQPGC